jgi:hypothetical protein
MINKELNMSRDEYMTIRSLIKSKMEEMTYDQLSSLVFMMEVELREGFVEDQTMLEEAA